MFLSQSLLELVKLRFRSRHLGLWFCNPYHFIAFHIHILLCYLKVTHVLGTGWEALIMHYSLSDDPISLSILWRYVFHSATGTTWPSFQCPSTACVSFQGATCHTCSINRSKSGRKGLQHFPANYMVVGVGHRSRGKANWVLCTVWLQQKL